jgi:hypothetical protein
MTPIRRDDRPPWAAERIDAARRTALTEAAYYRARAETHRRMGGRSTPAAYAVHRELSAAYSAAATAIELGDAVEFVGDHRAERPKAYEIEEPALLAAE